MAKYTVIRSFLQREYTEVEADSKEEAKKKAIYADNWEENPNDTCYCEYIVEQNKN